MSRPVDIKKLASRDAVEGDKRVSLDADGNLINTKQLGKPLSEAEMKALTVRDALVTDKRLSLDAANNFLLTNQPDSSAIGTAASKDVGTGAGQIPLNSDLSSGAYTTVGTASTKNTGTADSEIPLNSDLGSSATKDTGTGAGELLENSGVASYNSVSQGLTTGGHIIESGSNANGEYVKFADGTMICTLRKNVTIALESYAAGGAALAQGTTNWTFPVAFSSPPTVTCGQFQWGTGASWGTVADNQTITAATLRCIDIVPRDTASQSKVMASAFGRWK